MKAILLAGGHGTRLQPLTYYCNKHLLPIYYKDKAVPLLEVVIKQLTEGLDIHDIAVVLGDFRAEDIITYLHKRQNELDANFTYYYQGEPLGIAHAVTKAQDFVKNEDWFFVMLGDNIFTKRLRPYFKKFLELYEVNDVCKVLFAKVDNPSQYGSPEFRLPGNNPPKDLIKIVEKPETPQTNLALVGCYLFRTSSYFATYDKLKPSKRGEYELTDLINSMIGKIKWDIYEGFWSDCGTFESLFKVNQKLRELEE